MKKISLFLVLYIPIVVFAQKNTHLTDEEKIYGLSKLWSEAKYNFINFENNNLNWDSLYQVNIPKVLKAQTIQQYYQLLMEMLAKLEDGHTNVYYPDSINNRISRPALRTRLIENKIIITEIQNDSLQKNNIEIGDEIIEINQMNAVEYGKKYIMPYESASTRQDRINRTFNYSLFKGDINESIQIKLHKKNGSTFTTTINRKLSVKNIPQSYQFRIVNDSIGWLVIRSFDVDNYKKLFDSIYPTLLKTKALIIDIRDNSGGNSNQGYYVLSHLIEKPTITSKWKTKPYLPSFNAWGIKSTSITFDANDIKPIEGKQKYLQSIVVLTSARTYSAAEDFLVAYDNSKRGIKIGLPTGGSTGQPYFFTLPGGGRARICTKRDFYPNGKEFVGVGILPDIEVQETVKSIQEGKDITLEKAIEYINQKIK